MENQDALNSWILSHLDRLPVQIEHLTWTASILPGFFDSAIHLTHAGKKWTGCGISKCPTLSIHKSLTEALERTVMVKYNLATSNGVAGHITQEMANSAAINELVERDLFLCHFYSGIPFSRADLSLMDQADLTEILEWLEKFRLDISVHKLGEVGSVCAINGFSCPEPFGYIIGAAIKDDLISSVQSCVSEVVRVAYMQVNKRTAAEPLSLQKFKQLADPDFTDHGRLALDVEYAKQIQWLFRGETEHGANPANFAHSLHELTVNDQDFPDCPLFFSQAESSQTQNLFLGMPVPEKINFRRLSDFSCIDMNIHTITHLPHPFA